MQVVRNIVIFLILLPLVLMLLSPKKELYFLLEEKLYKQNIVISDEKLSEGLLGLTIEHPVVYYNGASIATAEKLEFWSLLLYTKIDFTNLKVAEGLPAEVDIESIRAIHSALSPMNIEITALSSIGSIAGEVALQDRNIHLDIAKDSNIKVFTKYLKKDEKGWYYESKF